jgi:type I restriction enzyme, R subunit
MLGDETLKLIAHELVETVKRSTGVDWTVRESVRARLRVLVRRILRKFGYPPDKQGQAVTTVLQQAELFAGFWSA